MPVAENTQLDPSLDSSAANQVAGLAARTSLSPVPFDKQTANKVASEGALQNRADIRTAALPKNFLDYLINTGEERAGEKSSAIGSATGASPSCAALTKENVAKPDAKDKAVNTEKTFAERLYEQKQSQQSQQSQTQPGPSL